MNERSDLTTTAATSGSLEPPNADPRKVARAFLNWSLPAALIASLFYISGEALSAATCLDASTWRFENTTDQAVVVTPFTVHEGNPSLLVKHSLERNRFLIPPRTDRQIELETGDFALRGVLVEYPAGALRVITEPQDEGLHSTAAVFIRAASQYPLAPDSLHRLTRRTASLEDFAAKPLSWIAGPALVAGLSAALVARKKSREERLNALREARA